MGVNSLPKTVTRQRRGCDLNPVPSAPESSTLTTRLQSHLGVRLPVLKWTGGMDIDTCMLNATSSMCVCLVHRYSRADKLGNNVRVMDVVPNLQTRKGENLYVQAKLVVDTLNRYMSSADELITTAHVPTHTMDKSGVFVPIQHAVRMVRPPSSCYNH